MVKVASLAVVSLFLMVQAFAVQEPSQPQPAPQATPEPQAPSTTPTVAGPAGAALPAALNGFGLEDGTPVKLRLTRNLSSATDKKGDTVDFEVMEDVRVDNVLVIPRGGIAWATITDAQPKRRMARGGKLDVNIDAVRLTNGDRAALRAVRDDKGGGHVGAMTGAMVATSIVFFPAAPLFLFMHGKDVNIPKGTEITAYIAGNTPLDKAKFLPGAQPSSSVAVARSAFEPTMVTISSVPSSADVEVDGKFVGNTPSSSAMQPGEHSVKVTKKGFKTWERKLTVSGGTATLNAELEEEKEK
jgi:hypothetical protein